MVFSDRQLDAVFRTRDTQLNWMTLNELRATIVVVRRCSVKDAERIIREAMVAGRLPSKWDDLFVPPPPQRDVRWATVEIDWPRGLVRDEWSGSFEPRELLVSRQAVTGWLRDLAAAPSPQPAPDRIACSPPEHSNENKPAHPSKAAMVKALWGAVGDPAYGIGLIAARQWIAETFDVDMPDSTLRYHLHALRERARKQES